MANTYTAIATTTVGSGGVSDVTFSSIPQTYTDLRLLCSIRNTFNGTYAVPTFNFNGGGQGAVYDNNRLLGSGSNVYTGADNNTGYGELAIGNAAQNTASMFTSVDLYIPTYTNSTNKTWIIAQATENNGTEAYQGMWCGQIRNTSAITSIKIFDATGAAGNIVEYSTFTLYGIKNS